MSSMPKTLSSASSGFTQNIFFISSSQVRRSIWIGLNMASTYLAEPFSRDWSFQVMHQYVRTLQFGCIRLAKIHFFFGYLKYTIIVSNCTKSTGETTNIPNGDITYKIQMISQPATNPYLSQSAPPL
jgi:hypothetical protein